MNKTYENVKRTKILHMRTLPDNYDNIYENFYN